MAAIYQMTEPNSKMKPMLISKIGLLVFALYLGAVPAKGTEDPGITALGCQQNQSPEVVLLSGPNEHWHADAAWFSLIQPLIAQSYCVWSIERYIQINELPSEQTTYQYFAHRLQDLATSNNWNEITIVSFASSNLTLHALAANEHSSLKWLKGAVMIDPDVLQPNSLKQYKQDTQIFKTHLEQIENEIVANKYTARIESFNQKELEHIKSIIPSKYSIFMDWERFTRIQLERLEIASQLNKVRSIAQYEVDLDFAYKHPLPSSIPLFVVNTDFEVPFIEQAEDKISLKLWKKEGDEWMAKLAKKHNGEYLYLPTHEHLLMFSDPETVIRGIHFINFKQRN